MAGTEGAREHPLGLQHLPACLALSAAAHWNQNAADWQWMLVFGRGYGLSLPDGTLAATTLTLPYGAEFAWISMVLVHRGHRRQGFASRLLRRALEDLAAAGRLPVLDATPDGQEIYRREGFLQTWGFTRLALRGPWRPGARAGDGVRVRPLKNADWRRIVQLDAPAFGADRTELLRALAGRLSEAALVVERDGELQGYLLGRDGREARQLGPLVARDAGAAQALLGAALSRVAPPLYVDLADREEALRAWLLRGGFAVQRPFTRMVRGEGGAPGDAGLLVCPAGPELG